MTARSLSESSSQGSVDGTRVLAGSVGGSQLSVSPGICASGFQFGIGSWDAGSLRGAMEMFLLLIDERGVMGKSFRELPRLVPDLGVAEFSLSEHLHRVDRGFHCLVLVGYPAALRGKPAMTA